MPPLEIEHAADPLTGRETPRAEGAVVAMKTPAAIAHQRTARGDGTDFAKGVDTILEWHYLQLLSVFKKRTIIAREREDELRLEKAFAQLNIVQDFIPRANSNRPGTRLVPTHITIHNTDNASPGADAAAHARYVKGQDAQARQVSWHYTVDDRVIFQSLPANEVGWHSGPGNSKSIGIEICMHQGMDEAAAYDRAALLVAVLAQQNGVAVPANVVQHNFWTGKHCPRVLRDRPNGWSGFLAKVQAALTALRAIPKAVDAPLTHGGGDDFCEVLSRSAGKGAARGKAPGRKAAGIKAAGAKAQRAKRKTSKRKVKKAAGRKAARRESSKRKPRKR